MITTFEYMTIAVLMVSAFWTLRWVTLRSISIAKHEVEIQVLNNERKSAQSLILLSGRVETLEEQIARVQRRLSRIIGIDDDS